MKKLLILTMAVLGMALGISAQNRSINFIEGKTFEQIKELAKQENKMIFIDFYTTWCGPCKQMDKEVYTNDSVADFYNTHFINIKMDAEKGEGIHLAKIYEVHAYPTFIFASAKGGMLHRSCGSFAPKEFIQLGKDALNPNTQISKLMSAYSVGQRDEKSVRNFIQTLDQSCLPVKKVVSDYLSLQHDTDLLSEFNWGLIREYVNDINAMEFKFMIQNYAQISKLYGDSLIFSKILNAYVNRAWDMGVDTLPDKDKRFAEFLVRIKVELSHLNNDRILAECRMNFYNKSKNWAKLAETGTSGVIEKYYWDRGSSLAHISEVFCDQMTDKFVLRRTVDWIKRSIELEDVPYSSKTYARLLSKLGEKDRAIEKAKYALELAKAFKEPTQAYEDLLNELKK